MTTAIETLKKIKLIYNVQVDFSFIGKLTKDKDFLEKFQADVNFICQLGAQIFSAELDPEQQKIWYIAFNAGLEKAIEDIGEFESKISSDAQSQENSQNLLEIFREFMTDCQAVQKIIPSE